MSMKDLVAIPMGTWKTVDLPKKYFVASMFGEGICAQYGIPSSDKQGNVDGFKAVVSNRPENIALIIQNHPWSKEIGVSMVSSKRYTVECEGLKATIVIETVADHIKRCEAFEKQMKEQGNE